MLRFYIVSRELTFWVVARELPRFWAVARKLLESCESFVKVT